MISFKSFVSAIHSAIMQSNDGLMDKNIEILDKYFIESTTDEKDEAGNTTQKTVLTPKSVILEYPSADRDGTSDHVDVPLLTLVPITFSQIEKATLTADFEMEIVNGELQLHFTNGSKSGGVFNKKNKSSHGKMEIVLSPGGTPEGLKLLVEGYEAILKRQIP